MVLTQLANSCINEKLFLPFVWPRHTWNECQDGYEYVKSPSITAFLHTKREDLIPREEVVTILDFTLRSLLDGSAAQQGVKNLSASFLTTISSNQLRVGAIMSRLILRAAVCSLFRLLKLPTPHLSNPESTITL